MNIIITGASSGIGFQTAKRFSYEDSNTVIAISRNSKHLELLKQECIASNRNSKIIALPFDLSLSDNFDKLKSEILAHFSHLDLLINNAGVLVNKPFAEIAKEELVNTFNVRSEQGFLILICQNCLKGLNHKVML